MGRHCGGGMLSRDPQPPEGLQNGFQSSKQSQRTFFAQENQTKNLKYTVRNKPFFMPNRYLVFFCLAFYRLPKWFSIFKHSLQLHCTLPSTWVIISSREPFSHANSVKKWLTSKQYSKVHLFTRNSHFLIGHIRIYGVFWAPFELRQS